VNRCQRLLLCLLVDGEPSQDLCLGRGGASVDANLDALGAGSLEVRACGLEVLGAGGLEVLGAGGLDALGAGGLDPLGAGGLDALAARGLDALAARGLEGTGRLDVLAGGLDVLGAGHGTGLDALGAGHSTGLDALGTGFVFARAQLDRSVCLACRVNLQKCGVKQCAVTKSWRLRHPISLGINKHRKIK